MRHDINGLTEETLEHLDGYKGSRPVRVGNAAYIQKQNDIYGILMDVIHYQIESYTQDDEKHEELGFHSLMVSKVVSNGKTLTYTPLLASILTLEITTLKP